MPWDQTTHPKIAMPMTAASVAQRHMGLKASIRDNEGVPSALVSNEFSRGLWPSKHDLAPSNCRDMLCSVMERGFRNSTGKTSDAHQGRAQGGDQAPLAAITPVSAAESETWSLVLCLRM